MKSTGSTAGHRAATVTQIGFSGSIVSPSAPMDPVVEPADDVEKQQQEHSSGSTSVESTSSSKGEEEDPANNACVTPQQSRRSPWYQHERVRELYRQADYWTLWISLLSFGLGCALVFAAPNLTGDRVKYVVPQPKSWTKKNPLDAWDAYNLVGVPLLLLLAFMALYLIALKATGKLVRKEETEAGETLTI